MNDSRRQNLFDVLRGVHDYVIDTLRDEYIGQEVALLGCERRARGRRAIIAGVICQDGVPLFLCMVTVAGTDPKDRQFLNGPTWSRQYRPWSDFVVLSEVAS